MIACTWSEATARSTPLTISVPSSSATCRFLSSSLAIGRIVATGAVATTRCRHATWTLIRFTRDPRDRDSGAHPHSRRRAAGLRAEAPARDGEVARTRHARVQGLDL